jgi:hypothetical protein
MIVSYRKLIVLRVVSMYKIGETTMKTKMKTKKFYATWDGYYEEVILWDNPPQNYNIENRCFLGNRFMYISLNRAQKLFGKIEPGEIVEVKIGVEVVGRKRINK